MGLSLWTWTRIDIGLRQIRVCSMPVAKPGLELDSSKLAPLGVIKEMSCSVAQRHHRMDALRVCMD
jgi:hypothetical protein